MYGRFVILWGLLFAAVLCGNAQTESKDAIEGLERYAAAIDAVESATFYYRRQIYTPALSEKEATDTAIRIANENAKSFRGIDTKSFESLINRNIELLMKENRQTFIHRISVGKNYLENTQFLPDGRMIQRIKKENDTLTTVNRVRLVMEGRGEEETNVREISPSFRFLNIACFEWRKALSVVHNATVTSQAMENGNILIKIESSPQGERQRVERYELEANKHKDFYIPAVFRTVTESVVQSCFFKQYKNRDGLLLPAFMEEEDEYLKERHPMIRPHETTYRLLPEAYKPGDEVDV